MTPQVLSEMPDLIFRDDRSGTGHIEFVAEAPLHLVLVDRAVRVESRVRQAGRRCKSGSSETGGRNRAEIGIAVFGEDRPIAGDGIVDTATDSPAHARVRKVVIAEEGLAAV